MASSHIDSYSFTWFYFLTKEAVPVITVDGLWFIQTKWDIVSERHDAVKLFIHVVFATYLTHQMHIIWILQWAVNPAPQKLLKDAILSAWGYNMSQLFHSIYWSGNWKLQQWYILKAVTVIVFSCLSQLPLGLLLSHTFSLRHHQRVQK